LRTSSATTANPVARLASPGRLDGGVQGQQFVWKAISSMVLTIFWVCSLAAVISFIEPLSSVIEESVRNDLL